MPAREPRKPGRNEKTANFKQPGIRSNLVEVHLLAQPGSGAALGDGLEDLQPVPGTRKAHVEDLVQSAGP